MAVVSITGYKCERCAHEWVPRDRVQEPRVCPKCKSPYWNRPRKASKRREKRAFVPNARDRSRIDAEKLLSEGKTIDDIVAMLP